jgi:hypothetical protein
VGQGNLLQVNAMMEKMFAISVESFLPNGKHCVILKTCTAALFRHYNQVLADCSPSNKVSLALILKAKVPRLSIGQYWV